ncbi:MAG: energy transducer TonB [Cellulophaga sp.]
MVKYGEFIPETSIKFKELGIDIKMDSNSKKIQDHIRKNFRYPELAQENGIQGKVTVQFTIDEEGNIDNLSILKGVHISLDTECFSIMNSLKKLEPYEKDGEKVMVYYTMPITFRMM